MPRSIQLPGDRSLVLGSLPLVMGIVNVTPDSFSDGGANFRVDDAIETALRMREYGAEIVDVGGESTRPGASAVGLDDELNRVVPVIEGIRRRSDVVISIDTTKAAVARAAIAAGAQIVNDVSALRFDPELASVIASTGAAAILMHMRGKPETMQKEIDFKDVVQEVHDELGERVNFASASGIASALVLVDPGIGFGKKAEHNLELLRGLRKFSSLAPVVVGASRKAFIGALTGRAVATERVGGSLAALAAAMDGGAAIIRVHDVRESVDFLKVRSAIDAGSGRAEQR